MTPLSSKDRTALRDAFERLLKDQSTEAQVRKTMKTDSGFDKNLWRQMAKMGILGLIIDPEFGGSGVSAMELGEMMEVAGAALLCAPLFSSAVMATSLLSACNNADAQQRLLPAMADGSCIATVAMTGKRGLWTQQSVEVDAQANNGGYQLNGAAAYVNFAKSADLILVVAKLDNDIAVFEIKPNTKGLEISEVQSFDRSQRFATLTFNDATAQRIGSANWSTVETMLDISRIALAGEQAGGAAHLFNMTVEYITNRFQFGRAVGGFQAIKHMAADLLLEKESAVSAARHAANSFANNSDDAQPAINLAAFACADAYSKIAFDSIQMHGGIGFTWEYPAHLYVRRARANAELLGNSTFYRERYLTALEA